MCLKITLISALLLIHSATHLQAQQWKEQIRTMVSPAPDASRDGASLRIPGDRERREALAFISGFLNDSIYMVRARALEVSTDIALQTSDTITRQNCVRLLIQPVAGRDLEVAGSALSLLRGFARKDFSPEVRDTITSLIRQRVPNLNQLIAIAGYIGIHELVQDLRMLFPAEPVTPITRPGPIRPATRPISVVSSIPAA